MDELKIYERKRMELYREYRRGVISREEYLRRIRPLDRRVDALEMALFPGIFPGGKEAGEPRGS